MQSKLLVFTIVALVTSIVNAQIDSRIIKRKWGLIKGLNHLTRFLIRLSIFTIVSYFYYKNIFILIGIIYQFSLFWIVFDLYLNNLRSLPLLYIGKTDWLDRILSNAEEIAIYIKICLLFIMLSLVLI